ncbi:hypothetical protein V8B97DRAFT_2025589 [Scleroderma yunnanense]
MAEICKCIDTNVYSIGLTKFLEIQKGLGLLCMHQQGHTHKGIQEVMVGMWTMYPDAEIHEMIGLLFNEHGMAVIHLQHCHFWVAGVNDLWAVDWHDKWLCFSLRLHTGIKPFSGQILWIKVWHSNHNPQLILSYYLNTVKEFEYIPMITQSDPSMKNFRIANAQALLQQMHDPSLDGYIQHWWMHTMKNIKPEIPWSQLCCQFSPGFEALLDTGVDAGWYDPDNMLQLMVFCWVFVSWLQVELNIYQDHINSKKCHDKRKVFPHGIPELIYTFAEDYGALNFKIMVSPGAIECMQQLYIDMNHIVFDLVQPSLNLFIEECYIQLGHPFVEYASAWTVYCNILDLMQHHEGIPAILTVVKDYITVNEEELVLLPGLHDLHEMEGYMGGVANGLGLHKWFAGQTNFMSI